MSMIPPSPLNRMSVLVAVTAVRLKLLVILAEQGSTLGAGNGGVLHLVCAPPTLHGLNQSHRFKAESRV